MRNPGQLRLFMVSNPTPFTRYEDHQAAIYMKIHDLVEQAFEQKEDPVALACEYLGTWYPFDHSTDELTAFLFESGEMTTALKELEENWHALDDTVPETSLLYGGVSRAEARDIYTQTTLRTFLEALTHQSHG